MFNYPLPQAEAKIIELLKLNGDMYASSMAFHMEMPRRDLLRHLDQLIKMGDVTRVDDNSKYKFKYHLNEVPVVPECTVNIAIETPKKRNHGECMKVSYRDPFVRVDTRVGRNRIIALERMKKRLIEEHHFLLDLVIADYRMILDDCAEED